MRRTQPPARAAGPRGGRIHPHRCAVGVARPPLRWCAADQIRTAVEGNLEKQRALDACFSPVVPKSEGKPRKHCASGARAGSEVQGSRFQPWRVGGVQLAERDDHDDSVASERSAEHGGRCDERAGAVRMTSHGNCDYISLKVVITNGSIWH